MSSDKKLSGSHATRRQVNYFILLPLTLLCIYAAISASLNLRTDSKYFKIPIYFFGSQDLVAFWAAEQLFVAGKNPYSERELLAIQKQANPDIKEFAQFHNPPWALTILLPFFYFSLSTTVIIWLALNAAMFFVAPLLVAKIAKLKPPPLPIFFLLSFLPFPFLMNLWMGQLSLLILCSFLLGIYCYQSERTLLSALFMLPCATKPHLVFLPLAVMAIDVVTNRRYRFAAECISLFAFAALIPLLNNPTIYSMLLAQDRNPFILHSACLASQLRYLLGAAPGNLITWPSYLFPAIAVVCTMLWYFVFKPSEDSWLKHLAPLLAYSVIFAPYAWVHDMVLLVPLQVMIVLYAFQSNVTTATRERVVRIVISANLLTIVLSAPVNHMGGFYWIPLVYMAMWYCGLYTLRRENKVCHTGD